MYSLLPCCAEAQFQTGVATLQPLRVRFLDRNDRVLAYEFRAGHGKALTGVKTTISLSLAEASLPLPVSCTARRLQAGFGVGGMNLEASPFRQRTASLQPAGIDDKVRPFVVAGSRTKAFWLLIAFALFLALAFSAHNSGNINDAGLVVLLLILCPITLIFAINLLLALPKIIANEKGIRKRTFLGEKFWTWDECGPFHLSTTTVHSHAIRHTSRFACAFSRRHHQAINSEEAAMTPSHLHADILIPLVNTRSDGSDAKARAVVETLNEMRERYQTPYLNDAAKLPDSADIVARLKRTRAYHERTQLIWFVVLMIFILIVSLAEHSQ